MHSVHPLSVEGRGGGGWGVVAPPTKFSKSGDFEGPQLLEGVCCFHIKKELKSEIFNDKESLSAKILFSVITKNSNWEILPKNLVTFKR